MTDQAPPVSFGPYLLIRASAALGRLELAVRTDVRDPEVCVLKRLPIQARAADAAARFRRQAQLAARLEHENIARTVRVETIEGQVCVARELIEGVSLSKIMRQLGARPAPLTAALHIVHELARGLGYAHDCGGLNIVHGEVAPENVMVAFSGQVKLIDFGIGRPAGDAAPVQTGVVVGHRGYLAPEAWDGREPDRAGDIYGLGVLLWELLTGQRADETAGAPLADARTLNPELPDELGRVVARATAQAPGARYRTAEELGAALTTFLPSGTDPREETVALVRSCFDVDTLQPLLAEDIAGAKRSARGEPAAEDSGPTRTTPVGVAAVRTPIPVAVTEQLPMRRYRGPLLAGLVALTVGSAGIILLRWRDSDRQPTAAVPLAPRPFVDPPRRPVPAPAPALPPPPPPAPATLAAVPSQPAPRASRRPPDSMARSTRDEGADKLLRQANDLFEHGNTAGALARTRQAIAAGAGAPAHVLMGTLLISLHNYTNAEPELAEAIRLDPHNVEARRLLALLQKTAAEHANP